jgi:hypothetical protein
MVIVSDFDNANHAEINNVGSLPKAAKLVETMLEAGFDQARIRVFVGEEMAVTVRQRPVVALVVDDESEPDLDDDGVDKIAVAASPPGESPKQTVAAEPYQKNGEQFSKAFRPA